MDDMRAHLQQQTTGSAGLAGLLNWLSNSAFGATRSDSSKLLHATWIKQAVCLTSQEPVILLCMLTHSQCSQQTGKGFPSLAQGYRWLLSTAWAQQLTSGLQFRPGYVPCQEGAPIKPSLDPFVSNAMVTHVPIPLQCCSLTCIQSICCMR